MNRRSIDVAQLSTNRDSLLLEISVDYDEGGMCYATYKQRRRGFYLQVSPVEHIGNMRRFTLFSGAGAFIEDAKRFNAKRLAQLATDYGPEHPKTQELIGRILETNPGLEVTQPVSPVATSG